MPTRHTARRRPRAASLRHRIAACAVALALAPSAGLADEITLDVDQQFGVQSNLFKGSANEIADGTWELRPTLGIRRPEANLSYEIEYTPAYEVYFVTEDVNGLDHFLESSLDYDVLSIGRLHLGLDVADYRAVRSQSVDGPGGIPDIVPSTVGDVNRIFATAGYEHRLRSVMTLTSEVHMQRYAYTTPNNLDNIGVGGELGLVAEPRSIFGWGGSIFASWRDFEDKSIQPGSSNKVLNANVILRSQPTSTLTLEARGGPAWVRTQQDGGHATVVPLFFGDERGIDSVGAVFDACGESGGQPLLFECPVRSAPELSGLFDEVLLVDYLPGTRPDAFEDDHVTFFLSVTARLEESWGTVGLSFRRGEDASASVIATTIRDSLTGSVTVGPWRYWSFRFRTNWNQREMLDRLPSTAIVAEQSAIAESGTGFFYAQSSALVGSVTQSRRKITQVWVDARAKRDITDRLGVELGFRYLWQERDSETLFQERKFDNYIATLLITYELGKYEFWTRRAP